MERKLVKTIGSDSGGIYAEVYTDDDDASGYGENAMSGRWYGTLEQCQNINPVEVILRPICYKDQPDEFDVMCERRWD